jgi:hypothetical protein
MRLALILLLLPVVSCAGSALQPTAPGNIVVNGVVHYVDLEGGFWIVRGTDNVTYDPVPPLEEAFRKEGLKVQLEGKIRTGGVSIRMVGTIIDVVRIKKI